MGLWKRSDEEMRQKSLDIEFMPRLQPPSDWVVPSRLCHIICLPSCLQGEGSKGRESKRKERFRSKKGEVVEPDGPSEESTQLWSRTGKLNSFFLCASSLESTGWLPCFASNRSSCKAPFTSKETALGQCQEFWESHPQILSTHNSSWRKPDSQAYVYVQALETSLQGLHLDEPGQASSAYWVSLVLPSFQHWASLSGRSLEDDKETHKEKLLVESNDWECQDMVLKGCRVQQPALLRGRSPQNKEHYK